MEFILIIETYNYLGWVVTGVQGEDRRGKMPKLIFLFVNFHRDVGVENFTIPPIKTDHDIQDEVAAS